MPRLTLTFDNGPFPSVTPRVLDVLATHGALATFFVCGKDVREPARRALVERARVAGHRVGSHSMTHAVELGATPDPGAPAREIGDAHAVLGDLASPGRFFRPYGAGGVLGPRLLSPGAIQFLCDGGYTCVLWNCVPRDWEDPTGWPSRALADIAAQDWTVLVLHDAPTGAMDALPGFLDAVRARGVTLTDAFPDGCVPIRDGRATAGLDGLVAAPA